MMKKIIAIPVIALFLLTGCTVNIESTGANAKFELSPARNIYPNTSVMNGLSLIPSGDSEKADNEEASKPDNQ